MKPISEAVSELLGADLPDDSVKPVRHTSKHKRGFGSDRGNKKRELRALDAQTIRDQQAAGFESRAMRKLNRAA